MPSQRFNYSIRYTINGTKDFSNLYLALSVVHVLRQNLLPKNYADYLPAPKAYWLLNFDCGTTIPIKSIRKYPLALLFKICSTKPIANT
jgi:hypothetical protein